MLSKQQLRLPSNEGPATTPEKMDIDCFDQRLPPLKVEVLDGENENGSEEHHPKEDHGTDHRQKAVLESKILLEILLHGDYPRLVADNAYSSCEVAELRSDESIHNPC